MVMALPAVSEFSLLNFETAAAKHYRAALLPSANLSNSLGHGNIECTKITSNRSVKLVRR